MQIGSVTLYTLQSTDMLIEFYYVSVAMIFVACLLYVWRDRHLPES
jgi:hypothetical protein